MRSLIDKLARFFNCRSVKVMDGIMTDSEWFTLTYMERQSYAVENPDTPYSNGWFLTDVQLRADPPPPDALYSPRVGHLRDRDMNTPLHRLVNSVNHPLVAVVRNKIGNTPLHLLARCNRNIASKHRAFDSVYNSLMQTPRDLASGGINMLDNPVRS